MLKRLLLEIGDSSRLKNALVAPKSSLPITVTTGQGIEFIVREVVSSSGSDLYIIACKREATTTVQVTFSGIPSGYTTGEVIYELPQSVTVSSGKFTDWFAPFDVHVYHFHK